MWDYKQKLNSIFSEKVCCETLAVNKLRHDLYKLEGIVLRRFGTGQEIFRTVLMHQYSEFFVFLFTCILLEFRLFSNCVMALAAQMCFYNLISQTVKFYVSLRAFKIRTGVIASFN